MAYPYRIDYLETNATLHFYKGEVLTAINVYHNSNLDKMVKLTQRLNSLKVFI